MNPVMFDVVSEGPISIRLEKKATIPCVPFVGLEVRFGNVVATIEAIRWCGDEERYECRGSAEIAIHTSLSSYGRVEIIDGQPNIAWWKEASANFEKNGWKVRSFSYKPNANTEVVKHLSAYYGSGRAIEVAASKDLLQFTREMIDQIRPY